MMWDFSGGRRSPSPQPYNPPYPSSYHPHSAPPLQMPGPSFPISPVSPAPHSNGAPPSFPPLPFYGTSYSQPSQLHSGYTNAPQAASAPPDASYFPSTSATTGYVTVPGKTIVIRHSKHHAAQPSSSGRKRERRYSLQPAKTSAASVPQIPIYTSYSAGSAYPLPTITFPPVMPSQQPQQQQQNSKPSLGNSRPSKTHERDSRESSSRPAKLKKPHRSSSSSRPAPEFHYSACTGRRKALCIGINYTGQANPLRGCVNDAKRVREFLIKNGGYRSENVVLLADDVSDPRSIPTRKNIIACMKWLVKDAQPNDALFFHYSGHGGQTRDLDGDEIDGYDEVIFPLDFKTAGHITDDEMHKIMVASLPDRCRLTALFDACHSGTVLDLPYIYSSHGRLKGKQISDRARRAKSTPADVISWSGCEDGQTSADTFHGGVAVGAMSHAFMEALKTRPNQSYQELLRAIRLILHPRYSQKPQLGSSHHIDTNLKFVF